MNKFGPVVLAVIAGLSLASCDKLGGGSEPKGQVVAKVGKSEITVLDLQTELAGFKAPNAALQKQAEQKALSNIIQRKTLAAAAKKLKIDKSPEFARQVQRADELLLIRTWQNQLVAAVPQPSVEEAQKFVSEHPDIYAARKRFTMDTIRFVPTDQALVEALRPINTMEEVTALLSARKVPFQSAPLEVDAFSVDPRFVEQLVKLPPGAVFVVPQGNVIMVATIRSARIDPVPDNLALKQATQYLRARRTEETVGRRFGAEIAAAQKTVKYNKAYEPPKAAPKPGAAPAPVTGPSPAPVAPPK